MANSPCEMLLLQAHNTSCSTWDSIKHFTIGAEHVYSLLTLLVGTSVAAGMVVVAIASLI